MSERSVQHATITVERRYDATPARVFSAWADPVARRRWESPGEGWELLDYEPDFRVGGREQSGFGPPGEPKFRTDTRYEDIVPDKRIVYAYTVTGGEVLLSASLATVELLPDGTGTRLVLTEQAAFLDGQDKPEYREQGLRGVLEKLGEEMKRAPAA